MRWRFPDPSEEQARQKLVARIDSFWKRFREEAAPAIREHGRAKEPWEGSAGLGEQIRALDPALGWELDLSQSGVFSLTITSEAQRHLRPLVAKILERAPALEGWVFQPFRSPKSESEAAQYVETMVKRGLDGWSCRVELGPHNLLAVTYGIPGCQGPKDREAHIAAMVATDALVGEELSERWVGAVRIGPPEALGEGEPLGTLHARATALRAAAQAALPARPVHTFAADAPWEMYKFNPRRQADYPGRLDMVVGKTMLPGPWRCIHSGVLFCSERFSRVGETFCYVKFDGDEGFGDRGFEDKGEAEDALDEALGEAKLGCTTGGGSGVRYGYIDLALVDVAAGFEVVRRVLREGKAPRRSWLLFFDDDLTDEWLGVHGKTPAPPVSKRGR